MRCASHRLEDAADPVAGVYRLQHGTHGRRTLRPGEFPASRCRLGAEFVTQNTVGEELLEAVHQLVLAVNEHARDPVDHRIGQSTRAAIADRGHTMLGGLDDSQSPALFG